MLFLQSQNKNTMNTHIRITDNSIGAKSFIEFARTLPFAIIEEEKEETISEEELYDSLNRAFRDVRLMMDGKKKEKNLYKN